MKKILTVLFTLLISTSTIADYGGNITNLNLNEKDTDFYSLRIDVDVNDNIHINNIIQSLRGLPVIDSVERILI